MEKFTVKEILLNKLNSLKSELFEEPLYQKTLVLFDIWLKQKELLYLYDKIDNKYQTNTDNVYVYNKEKPYKEQYISFLMITDTIFLEEVHEPIIVINLIYFWLLREVRIDKQILNQT